uniref:Nucleic-acid-binding protein n=1 Tax=Sipha flava TaxID=143950 RepID=A0A2S2PZC2_9HEMI
MELEPEQKAPTPTIATSSPLPIFICTVNDFNAFCNTIKEVTKGEQFSCKSSINGVKLSTQLPDSYRTVIKYLQCNKADFHAYQSKEDRAYLVVIRNSHHTTQIEEIKKELLSLGHTPRRIINIIQHSTKIFQAFPPHFIDLEPALNNKTIFDIKSLFYTKIKV